MDLAHPTPQAYSNMANSILAECDDKPASASELASSVSSNKRKSSGQGGPPLTQARREDWTVSSQTVATRHGEGSSSHSWRAVQHSSRGGHTPHRGNGGGPRGRGGYGRGNGGFDHSSSGYAYKKKFQYVVVIPLVYFLRYLSYCTSYNL